ncbi:MAG: penicillin-binding protein 2 [Gemmatimonadota bacterium]
MSEFASWRVAQREQIVRYVLVGAFVLLGGAFFRAQVIEHQKFQLKAESNRLRPVPLVAPRGAILDRHGRVIAESVAGYTVKLLAQRSDSLRAVLHRLQQVVPIDSAQVEVVVERFRQAPYQPVLVLNDATFEVVSALEEHRPMLPGLVIRPEPKRYYPPGRAVAHLVGYIGEVTDKDLEANRYPGARIGVQVGKAGLEQVYDATLRGTPGVQYVEVDARGRMVREQSASPNLEPVPGQPIRTTIDLALQQYVDSIWPPGVRGALVAMTPRGEILALYSAPSYDPNAFVGGISPALWRELNTDSARPLINRVVSAIYPPASPFKLATAAIALRRGLVDFDTHMPIPCTGGMQLGNRYFRCWKRGGHGSLNLTGAIAASCDVYFYQLGLRIGLDSLLADGVLMGFNARTGIDLPSERAPIFPSSNAYFNKRYGPRGWSAPATTMNFSIGQGENTQTLISMVRFYQALAGNGVAAVPYLVKPRDARPHPLGLSQEDLQGLREALIAVVERGTAAASRQQGMTAAGKTGTAQNPHGKDHGWFIGFAPAHEPEIVVGAIMEFAEHGSSVAPYVVKVMRRFVMGTEGPTIPLDSLLIPVDSAPRPVDLGDSVVASR